MKRLVNFLLIIVFLSGCDQHPPFESFEEYLAYERGETIQEKSDSVESVGGLFVGDLGSGEVGLSRKFPYNLKPLAGFEVEYLSEGTGIRMKKNVSILNGYRKYENHLVEVVAYEFDIGLDVETLADFLRKNYEGFEKEFVDEGVFVNEGKWLNDMAGGDAIRHFFPMSENTDKIHEVYLKLPSIVYEEYRTVFDEFALGINWTD